ncbi:MAG TPA: alginate lyase family protein [Spirosoma sp.]|nr:alginate lyase family protein [Spirosoma sp.]
MKQVGLVWRTIRHLTARQLAGQVLSRVRRRGQLRLIESAPAGYFLVVTEADKPVSLVGETFTFLNKPVIMPEVNWNFADHGKLWTYNLNYFDFLNQRSTDDAPGLMPERGLGLIRDFIRQTKHLRDGLEPYPTSLRIINWIQFLSRNQFQDDTINQHLYAQSDLLRRRLEYHIAGNHLLENGFALLMAALYFRQTAWLGQAAKLVRAELTTQLLTDGGHDERSPMYHQLLLDRLLDVLLAVKHNTWCPDPAFVQFLKDKATRMLGWLNAITFQNGDVPMVNDAGWNIAPTTGQLRKKAVGLGIRPSSGSLQNAAKDTGYRKFTFPRYELVADVGAVGPDHQPGHAHADTFSFVLYVDNQPLIVDSGTSTYESGMRRNWERSTSAHNTVEVKDSNSSEVWAGFRVGRRARVTLLADQPTALTARHDGYRPLSVIHERTWLVAPEHVQITDRLIGSKSKRPQIGVARLHFHPDVLVALAGTSLKSDKVHMTFASEPTPELRLTSYQMAAGFNRLRSASCVEIIFTNYLETRFVTTQ